MLESRQRALWFAAQSAFLSELAIHRSGALTDTRVVIDMSDDFPASRAVLDAVLAELQMAMVEDAAIVIIETRGKRSTNSEILAALAGYPRKIFAQKSDNDGACTVVAACLQHGFVISRFRICGVNTNFCVYETVMGLLLLVPKTCIRVLKQACNQEPGLSKWELFRDSRIIVSAECPAGI